MVKIAGLCTPNTSQTPVSRDLICTTGSKRLSFTMQKYAYTSGFISRRFSNTRAIRMRKEERLKSSMEGIAGGADKKRKDLNHHEAFTGPHYGYGYYYPDWGVSMNVPFG